MIAAGSSGSGEEGRFASLPAVAREEIAAALQPGKARPTPPSGDPAWHRPGASFVTLMREGRLRGCMGSLEARRPLLEDVRENARAAAFRDPRFPPLAAGELDDLEVEVSILSPANPLPVASEADACARLRPHVDGVVLRFGDRRATFLPQVWESLPEPREFLAHLKQKAGLPADFWHPQLELAVYTVLRLK